MASIGYLCSELPALSHTFISHEIQALEALGLSIFPFSTNPTRNIHQLGSFDQALRARTVVLKTSSPWTWTKHLAKALFSPRAWRAAGYSYQMHVVQGPRSLGKAFGYWLLALRLDSEARRVGVRHVHVHFANPAASVALIASKLGYLDYSLSIHGPDEFDNLEQSNFRQKILGARFVRAIGFFCRSQIWRHLPSHQWNKVHVVHCGIPIPPRPEKQPSSPGTRIICVGRLCPAKGQFQFLEVVKRLTNLERKFQVELVGTGPDEDFLRQSIAAQGLSDTIRMTGALAHHEVLKAVAQASLFVLPSFAEGIPVALMEAMALGVPVVSTSIAGIPELIESGRSGVLVPPSDIDGLVVALSQVLQGSLPLDAYVAQARTVIETSFDIRQTGSQMAALFAALEEA